MSFDSTLRPDPFIGRTFGAYRLTERIREVRVGAAFIAEHRHLDRHVVLKLFQPAPPGTTGGGLASVEARLRALSRAWHEHVLPLLDVGEGDDGLVFVALGLEDDLPLTSLVTQGDVALPWVRARAAGRQVAGALRWVEAQGIPLGELWPAQVFLTPARGGRGGRAARARIDVVTPEALGLVAPPARVDRVLDVGRLLYVLVTGHPPVPGAEGPPTDPVLKRSDLDIPGEADALIMRALDPDPRKRWPDLAALYRALGGRDDELGGSPALAGRRSTGTAASGAAWFASNEATGAEPDTDLLDAPVPAAADVDDRALEGGDDDGDAMPDRLGLDFDTDYDGREGSFGTRSLFVRPSRRAMASVLVAGAVAAAIAVIVIRARHHRAAEDEEEAEAEVTADAAAPPVVASPPANPGGPAPGAPAVAPPRAAPAGGELHAEGDAGTGTVAASGPEPLPGAPPPSGGQAAPPVPPSPPAPPPAAPATAAPPVVATGPSNGAVQGDESTGMAAAAPAPSPPAGTAPSNPVAGAAVPRVGAPPAGALAANGAPGSASAGELEARAPAGTTPAVPGAAGLAAGAAPPTPSLDASGRCSLSLGSKPWADVWIDGRRVGLTPLTDLPIACGSHEVVFTSTDLGLERRMTVTAQPGDKTRRIVDLEAPQQAAGDPAAAATAGRAARPDCRLSLGSRPWSEVWIDGRRVGVTPLMSVAVRCGKHDVLFWSREANVERRETIFVSEGQNVKRIVTLVEGE